MLMRLAIVCLVLGITADLHGQNKDTEKEIRSAYDAYSAAVRQRDVDGAMKIFTSDYTERLTNGVVLDYAGSAQSLKQTLSAARTIGDVRIDIKELQDQGGDVTATIREVFFYTLSAIPSQLPSLPVFIVTHGLERPRAGKSGKRSI